MFEVPLATFDCDPGVAGDLVGNMANMRAVNLARGETVAVQKAANDMLINDLIGAASQDSKGRDDTGACSSSGAPKTSNRRASTIHHDGLRALRAAQRERNEAVVDAFYSAVDVDGDGRLSRREVRLLLRGISGRDPTPETLNVTMQAAGGEEEEKAGGITKDRLLRALKKFHSYTQNQRMVQKVYEKYDVDGSGSLEREEVVALLMHIAKDPDRMRIELGIGGQPYAGVRFEVSKEDLDAVLDTADVDGDGNISREEVLGAIDTWLQLIYRLQRNNWTRKTLVKKMARENSPLSKLKRSAKSFRSFFVAERSEPVTPLPMRRRSGSIDGGRTVARAHRTSKTALINGVLKLDRATERVQGKHRVGLSSAL